MDGQTRWVAVPMLALLAVGTGAKYDQEGYNRGFHPDAGKYNTTDFSYSAPYTPVSIAHIQSNYTPPGTSSESQTIGYWLQNGTDPHSGIFVFLDGATGERKPMKTQDGEAPDIGNRVSVTGWVAEYYSYTELIHPRNTTLDKVSDYMPQPVVIPTGDLQRCSSTAEQWEGMLVSVEMAHVVTDFDQYGQIYVNDGSGSAQIDDTMFSLSEVAGLTKGASVRRIVGIVSFSYGEYEILPRSSEDVIISYDDNDGELSGEGIAHECRKILAMTDDAQYGCKKHKTKDITKGFFLCILVEFLLIGGFFMYRNREDITGRVMHLFKRKEYAGMIPMDDDIPSRSFYEPPAPA